VLCTNSIPLRRRARLIYDYALWATVLHQVPRYSKTPRKYRFENMARVDRARARASELVASGVARDAADLLNY